jgi:hypothetical protein
LTVTAPVLVLLVLSTLDAYRLALTAGSADEGGPACPYCGHGVDPELDFCPWCTERFEAPVGSERAEPGARGHDH